MKKLFYLSLVGLSLGIGGLTVTSAHAALKTSFKQVTYTNDLSYNRFANVAYHAKSLKKNAYIWNDTHTKKLYNIKSYPNYTWFKTAQGTYKGSSNWIRVANLTNSKQGWIYSSQLKKGFNSRGYQTIQKRFSQPKYAGGTYHVKSSKTNAYLWDWSHTKKRANLKNYTNQNLYRSHSVLMKHGNKSSWYYYVGIKTKNGNLVYGYVNKAFVASGMTTNHKGQNILRPDQFVGTKDYLQYINDSKYQKLARSIIELFPNSSVDYGLSKIAAYNYDTNDTWDEDAPEPISTDGYTGIIPFQDVANYLMTHKTQTNAQKVAAVDQLLTKAGYSKAKRAKLTNYKLGIYVMNNVYGGRVDESGTLHRGNWYGLIIGKVK